ncbi:MAG: hypothetical protein WC458_03910 [Patescibacteria group bacterium]|jgi:ABC-type amino acid transport system permease subunit
MGNFLTLNYWFNLRPETLLPLAQKIFIGAIILAVVLAIIVAILKNRGGIYRGLLKRFYAFFVSNAVIGAIFFFFNYESIPFLSARFWLGLWAITMIVWLVSVLKGLQKIPGQKKQQEQEKELKKYLPQ